MYNGNIINAVYSASTAGYSTTSEDIWGVSYPYLKRVKSEFDDKDPNWGIETTYTKDEVKERIESQTDIKLSDDVKNWFKIDSAFSGKYISAVTIDGHTSCTYEGSEARITGITLCNLFDVKSNAMEISYKDGVFTFKSYGWGHGVGMSQFGATDCSGLVMLSFAQVGINLPHYAASQALYGTTVSYNNMKKGDVIFFGGASISSIYHVAIYIGDGKMVHAQNTATGIVISNVEYFSRYNNITIIKRLI